MVSDDGASSPSGEDGETGVRAGYDWERTAPSTAVVETVARATGSDVTNIRPLYEVLDPDALDALFDDSTSGRADVTVSFTFAGQLVTVHGTGEVVVRSAHEPYGV